MIFPSLSCVQVEALLGNEGAAGSGSLLGGEAQDEEQQEWGLDEITDRRSQVDTASLNFTAALRTSHVLHAAYGDSNGVPW
jgi:hypothetical protein